MKTVLTLVLLLSVCETTDSQSYDLQRTNMVRHQIEARGISHTATLRAMREVERHLFIPSEYRKYAYEDTAVPIGYDQTISQPYIVALMTSALRPGGGDRVLEIGTGSGYQAAILAEIVKEVYTIEIVPELGKRTGALLKALGYKNIRATIGDGYRGIPERAPFDAIIVTAAAEAIPPALLDQLKEGGRMVIPLGAPSSVQVLTLIEKRKGQLVTTEIADVRFVPFTREK
jgi:protein-L-isoaspartate(D-aspartate) O-methyltransferase